MPFPHARGGEPERKLRIKNYELRIKECQAKITAAIDTVWGDDEE
jgi:hypothetical protein